LVDLSIIAEKLDADEKLKLAYRFPVCAANGNVDYEDRSGRLLDVDAEAKLFYVSYGKDVIWVKVDEVIDISPDSDN